MKISASVYIAAVCIRAAITPEATWQFDISDARKNIVETLPWVGAIFGGVYAALYARFASQWNYLANLYNQMMAMSVEFPPVEGSDRTKSLRMWQAGFIEDAEELHLATKPMFASVIKDLLAKQAVRDAFQAHTPDGARRLVALDVKIDQALERAAEQRRLLGR